MPQISITQLPQAQALTGFESVPIVQNGVTVQTTTAQIAGTPNLGYSFLTATSEPALAQSRYLTVGSGLSLTDGGAASSLQVNLTGAAQSLNASPTGIQVKTGSNTVTGRSLAVGAGLSVSNASGVAGDPTISLGTLLSGLASQTGTGILALQSGAVGKINILGVTSQTSISNGNGSADVTVGLASNAVLPGAGSVTLPVGTTAQRINSTGAIRYNTDFQQFEGYTNTGWNQFSVAGGVTSFSGGSTGLLPNTATTGAVVLSGTLVPASGGTGASTLSGYVYGNGTATMTASLTIPTTDLSGTISNAQLANSSLTVNGTTISLGGSGTITASTTAALTVGTGLQLDSGTTFNGSVGRTISINSTVATLTGSQTLTNKSISGSSNTLTNIPNSALTNSSITLGTTNIALGGTSLAPAGLTSVTVTQDPTTALQLATKQYVDGLVSTGLYYHTPVQVATTQSLAAQTGGTVTYNNGTGGVGATITLSVALTTLDGYSLVNGDRILIKNEVNQAYNGVYTWATGGTVLTRSTDTDSYGTGTGDLSENDYFFVQNGNVNKGTSYVCTTAGTITFGTTAITFAQFSTSQVYTAGTGLTLTNTTFSLTAPVTAALGGTGYTSYTTGDLLYASGATALSKLAIGAANRVLTSSGTAPQWVTALTGLTIDNSVIGATTPAAATFTTLTATGQTSLGGAAGSEGLRVLAIASAAQLVNVRSNTAGGSGPVISASSATDTDVNLIVGAQNAGAIRFSTARASDGTLGADQFRVSHTASAVNYVQATGAATTANPTISAQGSDTNVALQISAKSAGFINLATGGGTQTRITHTASAVNVVGLTGAVTGSAPSISALALAVDTNVGLNLKSLGTGAINLQTAGGNTQLAVTDTASAVNYVQVTGAATTVNPVISVQGSDASRGLNFNVKGATYFNFYNQAGTTQVFSAGGANASNGNWITAVSAALGSAPTLGSAGSDTNIDLTLTPKGTGGVVAGNNYVNYQKFFGGAAGFATQTQALGTDTNISMVLQPKGTGAVDLAAGSSGVNISNGGTVTALTRTSGGGSYTSPPAIAISAPTTAGGVQATASTTLWVESATVVSGGTGYSVNNVLTVSGGTFTTAAQLTVTSVSGGVITAVSISGAARGNYTVIPANPVSVTGGAGTGATFNLNFGVTPAITITNAGSGYVEQPTVTFSGGGGAGAAAYAVVGGGTTIRSLGSSLDFYTPNQQIAFRVQEYSGSVSTGYWTAFGGSTTPILRAVGSTSGSIQTNAATPIQFCTNNGVEQFRVAHTASAVNYVQVTGAATTSVPVISSQGSDTNISLYLSSKGSGAIRFATNNVGQTQVRVTHTASAVNFFDITGSATGTPVVLSSSQASSDTNVGLNIQSKGTGTVNIQTAGGTTQLAVTDTASAVNYVQVTGAATGNRPATSAQGSDTNIGLSFNSKGSSGHIFNGNAGTNTLFNISGASTSANYLQVSPAASTAGPTLSSQGSDTNIDLTLTPKGTGKVVVTNGIQGGSF